MANATTIEPPFVPQGHSTLAHPFMGGSNLLRTASPGRDERIASVASSSVQVLLHVLHAVLLEKDLELVFERHVPVVRRRIFNVFHRVLDARDTNVKGAVSFLPLEWPKFLECFVNPF
jgi:hypothetical protein